MWWKLERGYEGSWNRFKSVDIFLAFNIVLENNDLVSILILSRTGLLFGENFGPNFTGSIKCECFIWAIMTFIEV